MRISQVHIAGIGVTTAPDRAQPDNTAISAATKALLDAGITYADVETSFACFLDDLRVSSSCFDTFGKRGAPIYQIDNHAGLLAASQSIQSRQSDCALLVGIDTDEQQSQTWLVGAVLVSDLFLTSHAYLKDGAVNIRGIAVSNSVYSSSLGGPDLSRSARAALDTALRRAQMAQKDVQTVDIRHSSDQIAKEALSDINAAPQLPAGSAQTFTGVTGFVALCGLVWQLRGWASGKLLRPHNCLQLVLGANGFASAAVLRRSDGRPALTWEEVRSVRDGRERLGYNPAIEVREISREDLAHVMISAHFAPIESPGEQLQLSVKGGDRAALARL